MVNVQGFNPQTGEWNDSLTGKYMWGNTNIGETLSDVMTPFNWSIIRISFEQMNILPGYPIVGNIGGRAYNNVSVMLSGMKALGRNLDEIMKEMGGVGSEYAESLPLLMIPLPRSSFFTILRRGISIRRQQKQAERKIPDLLAGNLLWCRAVQRQIPQIDSQAELARFWQEEFIPYTSQCFWMVIASAMHHGECTGKLRTDLTRLVSPEDADKLLSSVSTGSELLASLGPLTGLAKVARGEMDRQTYFDLWGHRGPHESEVSTPRPAEDPGWLDQQLATLANAPVDAETLLKQQQSEFEAAWERFRGRYPGKAPSFQRRLEQAADAARRREAVRSEIVRLLWVSRDWALQAGRLTGLGEQIFLLTTEEVVKLLLGEKVPLDSIPRRQQTFDRYKALPPYPVIIRGPFDPFQWATDPQRRSDFFDAYGDLPEIAAKMRLENSISGVPGSAGFVEGIVRRLESLDESDQFQPGEILVTIQTNVGWTPLFPLAKAIVTDVGAALSHAAIVARELGIPAVVNCADATMRLKTGDRVSVDGTNGRVTILHKA